MKTIEQWKAWIQAGINGMLSTVGLSLEFTTGGATDTITLVMAALMNYADQMMEFFIDQAFFATATGKYLQRKIQDYGIPYSTGSKAIGTVTFSRLTLGTDIVIPLGTKVCTNPDFLEGRIFVTKEAVTILSGSYSVDCAIEAEDSGIRFNVEPHTIRYCLDIIAGLDDTDNANATSGGIDSDTDIDLRTKGMSYLSNLARGTVEALEYGAGLVVGVDSVHVIERPYGYEFYEEDDPDCISTGTFSILTDSEYHYGSAIKSTTLNDYVEFSYIGTTITPVFGGSTANTLIEIYIDNVLNTTVNTMSDSIIQPVTITTTNARHTIKLKLVENEMILDGFIVYQPNPMLYSTDIFIDDGSGSASWTLLKNVQSELEHWRGCPTRIFVKRCEIKEVDFTITVKWNTNVNKTEIISQITADLSEYLTTIKAGETVYLSNIIPIVVLQDVEYRRQILNCEINIPTDDIALEPYEIIRLGDLIVLEASN